MCQSHSTLLAWLYTNTIPHFGQISFRLRSLIFGFFMQYLSSGSRGFLSGWVWGGEKIKHSRPYLVAIFFMTMFSRPRGEEGGRIPPYGSATSSTGPYFRFLVFIFGVPIYWFYIWSAYLLKIYLRVSIYLSL